MTDDEIRTWILTAITDKSRDTGELVRLATEHLGEEKLATVDRALRDLQRDGRVRFSPLEDCPQKLGEWSAGLWKVVN